jgi:uncharacterized protein
MMSAFPHAMPLEGFLGGLLIGLSAALMLLSLGRIAGVSGLAARAVGIADSGAPKEIAIAFVLGLPLGALLIAAFVGKIPAAFAPSIWPLIIGGLLVGYGTRLGSGCTSGHGVCGLSRLSVRSMTATLIFMGSGFATVGALRFFGLLS